MKTLPVVLLLWCAPVLAQQAAVDQPIDLGQFARRLSGDAGTDYEKAERILSWLSSNFNWLATDYKKRTVQEIVTRKGGNCFELAKVFTDLIQRLDIKYRPIVEVNIHPSSESRQNTAARKVKEAGFRMSVFGRRHNDHRWVEIYDSRSGQWIPADPSMGVIGLVPWLKARVWFGERITTDTSITNNMIVPIGIFVGDSSWTLENDRTQYYLVDSFDHLYGGELSKLPSWNDWKTRLAAIGPSIRRAFQGSENLHEKGELIDELYHIYTDLRAEYSAR